MWIWTYVWMLGKARLSIRAGHAAHPYFEGRERAVNVAGEAWLASTWASKNVGIRQHAGNTAAYIIVTWFPHCTTFFYLSAVLCSLESVLLEQDSKLHSFFISSSILCWYEICFIINFMKVCISQTAWWRAIFYYYLLLMLCFAKPALLSFSQSYATPCFHLLTWGGSSHGNQVHSSICELPCKHQTTKQNHQIARKI